MPAALVLPSLPCTNTKHSQLLNTITATGKIDKDTESATENVDIGDDYTFHDLLHDPIEALPRSQSPDSVVCIQ